jgi:hypothetical protein
MSRAKIGEPMTLCAMTGTVSVRREIRRDPSGACVKPAVALIAANGPRLVQYKALISEGA